MTKINWMDGGILFELNKINNDFGENVSENNKDVIYNLYEKYINLGSKYITTNNYGFKPSRTNNWKNLTTNMSYVFKKIKIKYPFVKILGCIPPFHPTYYNGKITNYFLNFYKSLIPILNEYVDSFIVETQVNINHCECICNIINSITENKSIIISLYPDNIKKNELSNLINTNKNIEFIMINCCSFDKMNKYYNEEIKDLIENNINFGFYLNKINEELYKNNQEQKELQNYKHNDSDLKKIKTFIEKYDKNEIFIGGCCGYGVKEMKELIEFINIK